MGYMFNWLDVHGAGAQRSDPKIGDPSDYPTGHGPQGDAIRIFNYIRCVRDANWSLKTSKSAFRKKKKAVIPLYFKPAGDQGL